MSSAPLNLKNNGSDCFIIALFTILASDPYFRLKFNLFAPSSLQIWREAFKEYEKNLPDSISSYLLRTAIIPNSRGQQDAEEFFNRLLDQFPHGDASNFCKFHHPIPDAPLSPTETKSGSRCMKCHLPCAVEIDCGFKYPVHSFRILKELEILHKKASPKELLDLPVIDYSDFQNSGSPEYPFRIVPTKMHTWILNFPERQTSSEGISLQVLLESSTFKHGDRYKIRGINQTGGVSQYENVDENFMIVPPEEKSPAPPRLIVQMARFSYDAKTNSRVKIVCPVTFDPNLVPFDAIFNNNHHDHFTYQLKAAVLHRGACDGGHYVSLIRKDESSWWLCDDKDYGTAPQVLSLAEALPLISLSYLYFFEFIHY